MDKLSGDKISQYSALFALATPLQAANIHIFDQLDSTNTWLLNNKQCNTLCLAEKQLAGRGRNGGQWVSPPTGNIYLSYCYCFATLPTRFSLTTLAVGIAVCEALQAMGLQGHGLKWPNDIYLENKKLGGILLETRGNLQQVVIGIGLNITLHEDTKIDQPWCCLSEALASNIDRNLLIAHIVKHVQIQLVLLQQTEKEELILFKKNWHKWDILRHKTVSVMRGKEIVYGKVMDIDEIGRLGVQLEQAGLQYLNAAEIKIRC